MTVSALMTRTRDAVLPPFEEIVAEHGPVVMRVCRALLGPADAASAGESAMDDDLRAALDALPAKQRGAVIYRYLADLSYAEVGELLESSATAARRSAADGIANLRKHFSKGAKR